MKTSSANCTECGSGLEITCRACHACGLELHGAMPFPRLARLSYEERRLAEDFLLTAGNLSELARQYQLSRPTMRLRIDALLESLQNLRSADEQHSRTLLDQV